MSSSSGGSVLRVAVDGTPLLGRRTGIGRYTENLLAALTSRADVVMSATAFTLRGTGSLAAAVPAGVATRSLPVPARLLRSVWSSVEFPSVGWFAGPSDVFHATNFVLPPTGKAGGVVTIHDLAFLTMPDTVDAVSRELVELVPRSISRAAAICTPSAAVAGQIREAYGPGCPEIIVTPLGVDPEWLSVAAPSVSDRERLGLPAEYFLFVGTREPRKDLATLLAAYADFRAQWPSSERPAPVLLLVGPDGWGPGQEPVDGVVIRDYAPTAELRTIVAGAAAVVMPSRDEGFGLPALEGLAAGVPVIVSSVPALVEVTGGLAAVFPVGDVEALAAELTAVAVAGSAGVAGVSGMPNWGGPVTSAGSAAGGGASGAGTGQVGEAARRRREYAADWTWDRCAEATVSAYRTAAG